MDKNIEIQLVDFIDGTLNREDAQRVQNYINASEANKKEFEEIKAMLESFNQVSDIQPSKELRNNFYQMLEEEKQLQEPKVVALNEKSTSNRWKYAFQIAASFILLLSGYFAGNFGARQMASKEIANLKTQTIQLKEQMTLAMLDNSSASTRIQAVNFSEEIEELDVSIINALIERMQYDSNLNVRLAAAEALYRFSDSEIVKTAFIEALGTVKEPDLQMAIIQFLVDIQEKRAIEPMKQLLDQPETPDFIKAQANSGISKII